MQDLVCRADPTNLYMVFAGASFIAVITTTLFVKNLDRLRAAVKKLGAFKPITNP